MTAKPLQLSSRDSADDASGSLAMPKGQLGVMALSRGPEIRAALAYAPLAPALAVLIPEPVVLPDFAATS